MAMNPSRLHRDERAQGLIEFAIIGGVLLLFFLGTVDFGRFFYYGSAIRGAARAGAEVASSGCANHTLCGHSNPTTINDFIVQSTVCEASGAQRVSIKPQVSCTVCIETTCSAGATPCTGLAGGCTPCAQDVCIQRFTVVVSGDPCAGTPLAPTTGPTSHQCVKVIAGYNFVPITPLISSFFPRQACWSGDNNNSTTHTICASAAGKVY